MDKHQQRVQRLLEVAGTTYADEAGIRINDKPMPLFQLLGRKLSRAANERIAADRG